jgi:hypothetical protein
MYKLCNCGSGELREAFYDARGIFLTYGCDHCKERKLAAFRPEVLTDSDYEHDEPIDEE